MRPTDVPAWRLWLVTLCLLLALPASGRAAALIEMRIGTTAVRAVADRADERALLTIGGTRALFDLAGRSVYISTGGTPRRVHAAYRPGYVQPPPYRMERFGPGPVLAGFVTSYYVLFVSEQVCAELMAASWMMPFVDPALRALAILGAILDAQRPAGDDPCQKVPLVTYAAAGWPMIAGKIDHPTIETSRISFDYQPPPGELALPASFEEGDARDLRALAKAAGL
jgi:hypothetical protein